MSVKIVLEPEMATVCSVGAVVCFQVKSVSTDQSGNVVVDAEAVVFDGVGSAFRAGEDTPVMDDEPEQVFVAPSEKPVFESVNTVGEVDGFMDLTSPSLPEPPEAPVATPPSEKETAEPGIETLVGLLESEPPQAENQKIAEVKPAEAEPPPPVVEKKPDVPPPPPEKEESLFGARGPALLGESEKTVTASTETPASAPKKMEVVMSKERFYELLEKIDTTSAPKNVESSGPVTREKALAMESQGRIGTGFIAYVKNKMKGQLCIGDLNLAVAYGGVVNLGRISADRLKASSELYELLNSGLFEFITEAEAISASEKVMKRMRSLVEDRGEDVFDSVEEAEEMNHRRKPPRKRSGDRRKIRSASEDRDSYDGDDGMDDDFEEDGMSFDVMADERRQPSRHRNAVNMVPDRLMNKDVYVMPDERNELDMIHGDISAGNTRFVEDM